MILCDTGPLIAVIDPGQGDVHAHCSGLLKHHQGKLVTTLPCLTEAMYFAYGLGGRPLQNVLWRIIASDVFEIQLLDKSDCRRMEDLMERYSNVPMDFADASLVVTAEKRGVRKILTLDNDFRIYRFEDGGYFEVIP